MVERITAFRSKTIERVGRLSQQAFEQDYLRAGRPVIITGALKHWRALHQWTPEYLDVSLGHRVVHVAESSKSIFRYKVEETKKMKLSNAMALICGWKAARQKYYLMQQSIPRFFPELLQDFHVPQYIRTRQVKTNLWLGAAENRTPLHFDMANNFFAQIYGRKKFLLFDPLQDSVLYPVPVSEKNPNLSSVNIDYPNYKKYPNFRKAAPAECLLNPGEMLFLPAFWWHHVFSLDVTISVNFWWAPLLSQFLVPTGLRILPLLYESDRLLTIKKLVLESGEFQDFLAMARFLRKSGQTRAAALFAGAALEESIRRLYKTNVSPQDKTAYRDLKRMNKELGRVKFYSKQQTEKINQWSRLISASNHGKREITKQEVGSMISDVEFFVSECDQRAGKSFL